MDLCQSRASLLASRKCPRRGTKLGLEVATPELIPESAELVRPLSKCRCGFTYPPLPLSGGKQLALAARPPAKKLQCKLPSLGTPLLGEQLRCASRSQETGIQPPRPPPRLKFAPHSQLPPHPHLRPEAGGPHRSSWVHRAQTHPPTKESPLNLPSCELAPQRIPL